MIRQTHISAFISTLWNIRVRMKLNRWNGEEKKTQQQTAKNKEKWLSLPTFHQESDKSLSLRVFTRWPCLHTFSFLYDNSFCLPCANTVNTVNHQPPVIIVCSSVFFFFFKLKFSFESFWNWINIWRCFQYGSCRLPLSWTWIWCLCAPFIWLNSKLACTHTNQTFVAAFICYRNW